MNILGIKTIMLAAIFSMIAAPLRADPPASSNIVTTIDNLWRQAQFEQCESYITNLVVSYSNYLPARVAFTTFYLAAFDTDYDLLINELINLVNDVVAQNDDSLAEITSLLQAELNDRQIQRDVLLSQRGLTIQQIITQRTPTNVWVGNEQSWPNLHLIQMSPTNTLQ